MNFLTIHELSVEFDIPARVLRYRFHQLRQEAKLTEGVDYSRDDFVDDQHFLWKINPMSFMRETGLKPVTKSAPLVNRGDNQKPPTVITSVNQPEKPRIQSPGGGNHSDNHTPDVGSQRGNETDTKPGNKESDPSIEREMINLLKGQIVVKDGQIRDLTDQTLKLNDLNVKLVGQTLKQVEHIQTLLRLTGGKSDLSEVAVKEGEATPADGGKMDTKETENGYQTVNDTDNHDTNSNTKIGNPPPGGAKRERPLAA